MAVILSNDNIELIISRLRGYTHQSLRDSLITALEDATGAPDDVELMRTIRDSGARKRIDIAKAIVAEYFDD
jgi:hypothetical protein